MQSGFVSDIRRFGWLAAAHDRMYWRASVSLGYRALAVVFIELTDLRRPQFLENPKGFRCGFLKPDRLLEEAATGDTTLTPDLVRAALARGDRCYGITHGEVITAYGWYATEPVPLDGGVQLRFGRDWVHMYGGYTRPEYRGRRLHAIGMSHALREFDTRGYRGLMSLVETDNHASLRSCVRMGYRVVGYLRSLQWRGRPLVFPSRRCARYDVSLEAACPEHLAVPFRHAA